LQASDYVVVVNKKNTLSTLSKQQLKNIFLKKKHFIADQKLIPVNISANEPLRIEFEKSILGMDRQRLNSFWTKQHFHGVSPPSTQSSTHALKLFVQNVEGAIGYLPKDLLDNNLKVVYEF
jgi:ABC-type phosphate transport system substrate-binding protein